jgi:hypothetical protein
MKKIISVLLILMMLLALTACGANHEEVIATQPIAAPSTEATLSPREQFQQQKEAMDALLNKSESGEAEAEAAQPVVASSFSAGGITLLLDSSFKAQYDEGEELMTYWHSNGDSFSYTMKIGITISANYAGYKTSQEAAEDIAAQKPDVRTVESANGVYYIVQTGQLNVIKAYYVDDSGYIWIVDGMTSTSVNFADYKDQLIQFCTSGSID